MQLVKNPLLLVLLTACLAATAPGYAAEPKQKDAADTKPAAKPDAKPKARTDSLLR